MMTNFLDNMPHDTGYIHELSCRSPQIRQARACFVKTCNTTHYNNNKSPCMDFPSHFKEKALL